MNNLFSVFELFAGVYLIYSAITGKGQLFTNENIKKGMEEKYRKTLRICAAVVGPVMVAQGVLDYMYTASPSPVLLTITGVLFGISLIGVGLLFFFSLRMTDREKVKSQRSGVKSAPRAAFEFDEDDKNRPSNSPAGKGNKGN